jgi:parallel beta-helix repeat protein
MNDPVDAIRLAQTSRVLTDWFENDAPRQEPIALLNATLARTAAVRPRSGWRVPGPWLRMAIPLRSATVPRLVLSAAMLAMLLSGLVAAGLLLGGVLPSPSVLPKPIGPRAIVVAPDGSGDTRTITEAVAMAADGDHVLIRPGTYREAVIVDKDISIRGDGPRKDIIVEAPPDSVLPGATRRTSYAFLLQAIDGSLANVTVVGQQVGTAIVVKGGTPTLEQLDVNVLGDWSKSPRGQALGIDRASVFLDDEKNTAHRAIAFDRGSGGVLRDSTLEGFLWFGAETTPIVQDSHLLDTCIEIAEAGAHPVFRRNEIHGCPHGWGVLVAQGAAATIDGNDIVAGDKPAPDPRPGIAVIVQTGALDVTITGNTIHDSDFGVSAPYAKQLVVDDNVVTANNNGLSVIGATGSVTENRIRENRGVGLLMGSGGDMEVVDNVIESNGTGILIDGITYPTLRGNTICRNERNLTRVGAAELTLTGNDVCPERSVDPFSAP